MTRQQALAQLIRDVQADIASYSVLRDALDHQFQAALRHDSSTLSAVAQEITDLVSDLEQRRQVRVTLTQALTGNPQPASIAPVLTQLASAPRALLATGWDTLEGLVRECKARNTRNCELIVAQHSLMQRVLHGEEGTYAAT